MVTDMGASTEFSVEFLMKEENWKALEDADIICSEVNIFTRNYLLLLGKF